MSDVFISYSRRDIDFVRHLFDQLKARDSEPWADWQDIPPTADWLAEIYSGIEAANSFLFVISPDSVASEICTLEIEHAVKHNKRLVPVVWKDADDVHQSMSAHNWVFLRVEDDFEANFELLLDALGTDLDHVREHTRLLQRAIEWDRKGRRRSLSLHGIEVDHAKSWMSEARDKRLEPIASELHLEYIYASSREAENKTNSNVALISFFALAFIVYNLLAYTFVSHRNDGTVNSFMGQVYTLEKEVQRLKTEKTELITELEQLKETYLSPRKEVPVD